MKSKTNINNLNVISKYHQDKGLTIIGLNDNLGFSFYKNFLTYLKEKLTNNTIQPEVIDAYLTTHNQTWQVESLLKHNLSIEEIQNIKLESLIELAKQKYQSHIILSFIINELTKKFSSTITDRWEFISEIIKRANEPLIIYSSGLNDLQNASIESTINQSIINDHRRNFENIYSLNLNSTIYMLEIPKYYHISAEYQNQIQKLCQEYNVTTIPYPNNKLPRTLNLAIPSISNNIQEQIANTIINTYANQILKAYQRQKELKEKCILISSTNILSEIGHQLQAQGKLNNFKIDSLTIAGMLKDIEEKIKIIESQYEDPNLSHKKINQLQKEQLILTKALNKKKIEI